MKLQLNLPSIFVLALFGCSQSDFSTDGKKTEKEKEKNSKQASEMYKDSTGSIRANFHFSADDESLVYSASFMPKSNPAKNGAFIIEYKFVSNSEAFEATSGFPKNIEESIRAASINASVERIEDDSNPYKITFILSLQELTLSQQSEDYSWTKSEGEISGFDSETTSGKYRVKEEKCKIEPSGNQPRTGLYSVILTKPAPCDFKLPTVRVSRDDFLKGKYLDIEIGTYWQHAPSPEFSAAHQFPLGPPPKPSIALDNGFIMVQPDGISYLLVDAGIAMRNDPGYRDAKSIANDVSRTLGFGNTTLLKPSPGSASDDYATTTMFKKGSVLIIYDDTPDMAGSIDVDALVSGSPTEKSPSELVLKWDAAELK